MKIPYLIENVALATRLFRKIVVAVNRCGCSRLLLCSFILLTGCRREVLHDLSEPHANTIVARLHTVDIEARKTRQADGNWSILVQDGQFQDALLFLTRARLVQSTPASSDDLEGGLFPKNSRGSLSYQKWLGAEIRETLRSLPGVLDAKVHLYLPKQDSLFERQQSSRGTGSVLLIVSTEAHLVNEEVAQLVAGAAGLQHQDVSVLQTVEVDQSPILRRDEARERSEHVYPPNNQPSSSLSQVIAYLPPKSLSTLAALLLLVFGSILLFRGYRNRRYPSMPQGVSSGYTVSR